ncbi:MAG: hypothetical protein NZ941_05425 [Candidatus Caldarchaeum sp.]|nr:hypothetical protein [Candidatus Caldarchaeum sp.]MDW7977579.1 hypothetical protein [Candidatus Caldarchaeum sp.]
MELVERSNPWWFLPNWTDEDRTLVMWNGQKVRWMPSWLDSLSTQPYSLNFVYGPRQTGKTT